jgi:uncharacterized protein (TIGR03000 family)
MGGEMGMPMPSMGGTILPPAGDGMPQTLPPAGLSENRTSANQATFVVRLPADATLLADNAVIPGSGPVRVFSSPPLEPGRKYFYELAIEVNRGGKVLPDRQRVEFEAGKTANVTFNEPKSESPAPPMATPQTKGARIRVRVPEGATLYVEGRPWSGSVVQTPPLDPTRTHYYQLTVLAVRDGRPVTVNREVAFRAGQELTVDLTTAAPVPANVTRSRR